MQRMVVATTPKAARCGDQAPKLYIYASAIAYPYPPSQICCLAPQIWYAAHICIKAAPSSVIPVCAPHTYILATRCWDMCK